MFTFEYLSILIICIIGVGYTSYKRGFANGCAETTLLFIKLGLANQKEVSECMNKLMDDNDLE